MSSGCNTYSRSAWLHNDWPISDQPPQPQNLDALIAKLTYWLLVTGVDWNSGLRFIVRSNDSQDEVDTLRECLAHLQAYRDGRPSPDKEGA